MHILSVTLCKVHKNIQINTWQIYIFVIICIYKQIVAARVPNISVPLHPCGGIDRAEKELYNIAPRVSWLIAKYFFEKEGWCPPITRPYFVLLTMQYRCPFYRGGILVGCIWIYNFNGRRWQVEVLDCTPEMPLKQPQGSLIADADRLSFPFICRKWRQGDWMIPFGMKGRKKVSDVFSDLKFTSIEKDAAVMIVDCRGNLSEQQHIAGILGLRMDDRYKVTAATKSIIRITLL